MASQPGFDPYHQWLGIQPAEQPPNHYRLLGLVSFESDPNVIEQAADRQMAHVRTFQTGPRSAHSQRLLNELSTAKLALLKPATKLEYDDALRAKLTPAPQPAIVAPPTPQPSVVAPPMAIVAPGSPGYQPMPRTVPSYSPSAPPNPVVSTSVYAARTNYSKSRPRPRWAAPLVVAVFSAVVVIIGLSVLDGGKGDLPEIVSKPATTRDTERKKPSRSKPSLVEIDQERGVEGSERSVVSTGEASLPVERVEPGSLQTNKGPSEESIPDDRGVDSPMDDKIKETERVGPSPKNKPSPFVQQLIDRLNDPSEQVRAKALVALSRVLGNDVDVESAYLAVLNAFDDISPQVRANAITVIGKFGPRAKTAVPAIVARYRADRDKWDTKLKTQVLGVLGIVNGDSEKGIKLLIEVAKGTSSGKARMFSKEYDPQERLAAVNAIAQIGPPAEKAVPTLLEVLKLSAVDLTKYLGVFKASADALGKIGIVDRGVKTTLMKIRDGKGIRPPEMAERAKVAADSVLRRLEQSGRISGQGGDNGEGGDVTDGP